MFHFMTNFGGGDLIDIICHFLSFHMGLSVLNSSLVKQNRLKKIFKAPLSIWSFLEGEMAPKSHILRIGPKATQK